MNHARVISTGRVSVPNTGEPALQICTDLADPFRAFYVEPDTPAPAPGDLVQWGTGHAVIGGTRYRKLGYSFDPDKPLG